jgi:hypothetical protein
VSSGPAISGCILRVVNENRVELPSGILSTLDLDDWDLREDTVAPQVPGWDSLIAPLACRDP